MLPENSAVFVTGGAGFIGSALIHYLLANTNMHIINIDKLTYAGQLTSIADAVSNPRYTFIQADICNKQILSTLFRQYQPLAVMHLAAESHVDHSIDAPAAFIQSNIVGAFTLLEATREYWRQMGENQQQNFRFLHVSTDEVFGDLGEIDQPFTENSPYHPSSPYAASKASADHLVQAWHRTYGLPTLISHSSNNYGPRQFPEKLIPLTIIRALQRQNLPIYGSGTQIRDWLHVDDHVRALWLILNHGQCGHHYAVSAQNEWCNMEIVHKVCAVLDELCPLPHDNKLGAIQRYSQLITHVSDRPGHDWRYALNAATLQQELNWQPKYDFVQGLRQTVQWYLDHRDWWQPILMRSNTAERQGLSS